MSTNSTNKFSWKKALVLSIATGLLAGCFSIVLQTKSQTLVQEPVVAEPSPVIATAAAAGLGSSFNAPALPVRLIIPAIGVNANIQSVGLFWNGDGEMSIPTNFTDVAWYNGGPRPGMPGSAVIDGHLDGKNVKEAVFYNLGNLKPGDQVEVVDASGTTFQFRVTDVKTYAYDATTTDIFSGDDSKVGLNLITCAGDWLPSQKLYDQRVVVFTEMVTD